MSQYIYVFARFVCAIVVIGLASSAQGAHLTNLVVTNTSAADFSTHTVNDVDLEGRSVTGILSSNLTATVPNFSARLGGMASADSDPPGGTNQTNHNVAMQVAFDIVAAPSQSWTVSIDQARRFALTIIDDNPGSNFDARAGIKNPFATYQVQGAVNFAGNLSFPGSGTESTGFTGATDAPFSATTSDLLLGFGPATVTLAVGQTLDAEAFGNASAIGGKESAVRFGMEGTQPAVLADDYPAASGRLASDDGHFLSVEVEFAPIPEPATFAGIVTAVSIVGIFQSRRRR